MSENLPSRKPMDFLYSSILGWVLPITTYRANILKFKGWALMKSTVFMYSSKTVLSIAGNCFVDSDSLCMQQWINFASGDTAFMWSTTPVYWLVIMWTPWILILTYLTNHYLSPLWCTLEFKKCHVKLLMYAIILKSHTPLHSYLTETRIMDIFTMSLDSSSCRA